MDIIVKRRGGFTLAEVLITLSIIGVVAALTIPSLVVKNQEKETVVQLKKAYNTFSNAFALARVEYGNVDGWSNENGEGSLTGSMDIMDRFSPFLNLIKRCNGTKGCFPKGVIYKQLVGTDNGIQDNMAQNAKGILADGTMFDIYFYSGACNTNHGVGKYANCCAHVTLDLNGEKHPNVIGKDMFMLHITKDGILPAGGEGDVHSLESWCAGSFGWGCTAWVLLKENMNYPPQGTGWN